MLRFIELTYHTGQLNPTSTVYVSVHEINYVVRDLYTERTAVGVGQHTIFVEETPEEIFASLRGT